MLDLSQKSMLVRMTNDQGFFVAKKIAEDILTEMATAALECEADDSTVARVTRDARAARRFWDAFLTNLDHAKDPTEVPEGGFVELNGF